MLVQAYSRVIQLHTHRHKHTHTFFFRFFSTIGYYNVLNIILCAIQQVLVYLFYIKQCVYIRRRQWHPTPVLLPGKSNEQGSLVGCSPWGREELNMAEQLHFHFSLSCIGEGNGNPLQCSCLENPRDGKAWWAAVYGVVQGRTQLKRLSSSSSSVHMLISPKLLIYSFSPHLATPFSNHKLFSTSVNLFCK